MVYDSLYRSTTPSALHLPHFRAQHSWPRPCPAPPTSSPQVRLKTRADCELAVSFYPRFRYNAVGGGGWGTVTNLGDGKLHLNFDTSVLIIPDMSYRTATLMGLLPIPPPLNIAIKPRSLEVGSTHGLQQSTKRLDGSSSVLRCTWVYLPPVHPQSVCCDGLSASPPPPPPFRPIPCKACWTRACVSVPLTCLPCAAFPCIACVR